MSHEATIEALERAASSAEARKILRPHAGADGLSAAFFGRVLSLFSSDQAAAARLARWWRIMLKYGDEPALAYRAKGAADRLAGRWLASARAFQKAGETATNERDRLSYQTGALDGLSQAAKIDEAVALGTLLADGLIKLGEDGLAGRVMMNVGNALVQGDRYAESRTWLSQAVTLLEKAELQAELVYAHLVLSTSHLHGGDPAVSQREAEAAREGAAQLGMDYIAAIAGVHLAQSALVRGRADDALRLLLEAKEELADVPTDVARLNEFLGDAYYRLNMWPEAADAYREAEASGVLSALNVANLDLGLGQALLADGNVSGAELYLKKAVSRHHRLGNPALEASSRTALAEARARLNPSQARRIAQGAAKLALDSGSNYYAANALLVLAEVSRQSGREEVDSIDQADQLIQRFGYRELGWRVHALRAAGARASQRLRHYRRMFEAIAEGRLLQSSVASRSSYLRDKADAIGAYIQFLLERPTFARVDEAISVVERSRSAALLDEIVSARGDVLSAEALARLEGLREELRQVASPDFQSGDARRMRPSSAAIASVQRRWIEATRGMGDLEMAAPERGSAKCVILTQAGETLYALCDSKCYRLGISASELERKLLWLQYELLAPMADRDAPGCEADALLREIAVPLIGPWFKESGATLRLSPDGLLWKVPWVAACQSLDIHAEPVLCLHPSLAAGADRVQAPKTTMLWVHEASDLRFAAREETAFLECYPDSIVCRNRTEAFESLNRQVDLLHVIGHARHNSGNPMFSYLNFGDGPLYATEIARSGFRAGMVTLSACDTGAVSVAVRNEPDGLARAFLACGARSVVGSAWPLDDEAAGRFYSGFYSKLSNSESLAHALSAERRALRSWRSHPYFWGSLVIFGGYSRDV